MVAIAEKQNVKNISTFNIWVWNFYDEEYLDSPEVLLNDWKLIQEAEKNYDPDKCMSAEEAYLKTSEYINNLK